MEMGKNTHCLLNRMLGGPQNQSGYSGAGKTGTLDHSLHSTVSTHYDIYNKYSNKKY